MQGRPDIGCAFAVDLKHRQGFDDALDVVGVHAVGGIIGALLIGLFATTAVNAAGANGLFYGGGLGLLGKQALAIFAASAYSFGASWVLLLGIKKFMGLRVTKEQEFTGLDVTQHRETGYTFEAPEPAATI